MNLTNCLRPHNMNKRSFIFDYCASAGEEVKAVLRDPEPGWGNQMKDRALQKKIKESSAFRPTANGVSIPVQAGDRGTPAQIRENGGKNFFGFLNERTFTQFCAVVGFEGVGGGMDRGIAARISGNALKARGALRACRGMVVIVVLLLGACGTLATPSTAEEVRQAFPFIADGVTTKEVLAHRGFSEPDDSFENGRIWAFAVGQDRFGDWRIGAGFRRDAPYDMILIFDAEGVLLRHGLVLAR